MTVWPVVDAMTLPQRIRLDRDERIIDDDADRCDIRLKPRAVIPSLWDQAVVAIEGRKGGAGAPGALAERSLADLELIDVVYLVRVSLKIAVRQYALTSGDTDTATMRRVAAHIDPRPDLVDDWGVVFADWHRRLVTALDVIDGPHARRLWAPCPACRVSHVLINNGMGPVVARPLLLTFTDGRVRAVECESCHAVWWRGDQLLALADAIR